MFWFRNKKTKFELPPIDIVVILFDSLMVFLKEFIEKVDFEKNQQTTKKHAKLPSIIISISTSY